jgi:hypothetical protein
MSVKLLEPEIVREKITKDQYHTIPEKLRPYLQNYPHLWKVTVIPKKSPESGLCRVNIVAAANMRTGTLGLENLGREPKTVPPSDQDDLRSTSWYVFGVGTQRFKVILASDMGNYVEKTERFD